MRRKYDRIFVVLVGLVLLVALAGCDAISGVDDAGPVFAAGTVTSRQVAENTAAGTAIGAPFVATDEDGDEVTYTLEGTDAASFAIGAASGVLTTRAALDYETKRSYAVTVKAADEHGNAATLAVTITVTNVDEAGSVSFEPTAPGVGTALTASVEDPDGSVTSVTWQWAKASTQAGPYTDIPGATSAAYTPVAGDVGAWLRATASYADGHGAGKSAAGVAEVTASPVASLVLTPAQIDESGSENATTVTATLNKAAGSQTTITVSAAAVAPATAADYEVSANTVLTIAMGATTSTGTVTITALDDGVDAADKEVTVSGSVSGIAVTAPADVTLTIADDDASPAFAAGTVPSREVAENTAADTAIGAPFVATDPDGDVVTYTLEGTDAASFAIGTESGVLTTRAALDYETKSSYEVTVKAADEHGNAATLAVTIMVTDVDDASPAFADDTVTSREVAENTAPGTAIGAPFMATDPDSDVVTYTLEGTDADSFAIGTESGVLTTRAALDYETKSSYAVTVKAADEHGNAATLAVTITVTDVDEAGSVSFDSTVPVVGSALTASVEAPDGSAVSATWQWAKASTRPGPYTDIPGATSAAYTPVSGDAGAWLRVTASYTNGTGADTSVVGVVEGPVAHTETRPRTRPPGAAPPTGVPTITLSGRYTGQAMTVEEPEMGNFFRVWWANVGVTVKLSRPPSDHVHVVVHFKKENGQTQGTWSQIGATTGRAGWSCITRTWHERGKDLFTILPWWDSYRCHGNSVTVYVENTDQYNAGPPLRISW